MSLTERKEKMKKTISMLLVCVLLLGTVFALSSCGLSGTYKNDLYTLEFSGDKVHITAKVSVGVTITSEYDATYKISDGENGKVITFTYADDADKSVIFNGEKSYNEGSDNDGSYIEVGGIKLYKK